MLKKLLAGLMAALTAGTGSGAATQADQFAENFVGRWFTFYCKEIEDAYMKKDKDGMDEILKDLSLLRNYIWHKSPVEENVSDDTDMK